MNPVDIYSHMIFPRYANSGEHNIIQMK